MKWFFDWGPRAKLREQLRQETDAHAATAVRLSNELRRRLDQECELDELREGMRCDKERNYDLYEFVLRGMGEELGRVLSSLYMPNIEEKGLYVSIARDTRHPSGRVLTVEVPRLVLTQRVYAE